MLCLCFSSTEEKRIVPALSAQPLSCQVSEPLALGRPSTTCFITLGTTAAITTKITTTQYHNHTQGCQYNSLATTTTTTKNSTNTTTATSTTTHGQHFWPQPLWRPQPRPHLQQCHHNRTTSHTDNPPLFLWTQCAQLPVLEAQGCASGLALPSAPGPMLCPGESFRCCTMRW